MINRINLILQAKNITARQFAEEIGIQPSGMSHILGGRNNPSLDFVAKVLRRYPEIDANWLIMGRGQMLATAAQPLHSAEVPAPSTDLFADLSAEHNEPQAPLEAPRQDVSYDIENEPAAEQPYSSLAEDPCSPTRRIVRLLFVYNDGTFEECVPQR